MKIYLREAAKRFGGKVVFSRLQATFSAGRCHCIYGENGSGKSTLLKCIGRYLQLDGGSVSAERAGTPCSREEHRRLIGMVSPDFMLYQDLTAWENVQFFAGLRNPGLAADGIEGSLDAVGLLPDSWRPIRDFSTGMRQRIKWAVLLASDRPVWLLDEPSSNLDEGGRLLVQKQVEQAVAAGKLVVLATNEPAEVRYATDVLALEDYKNSVPKRSCP